MNTHQKNCPRYKANIDYAKKGMYDSSVICTCPEEPKKECCEECIHLDEKYKGVCLTCPCHKPMDTKNKDPLRNFEKCKKCGYPLTKLLNKCYNCFDTINKDQYCKHDWRQDKTIEGQINCVSCGKMEKIKQVDQVNNIEEWEKEYDRNMANVTLLDRVDVDYWIMSEDTKHNVKLFIRNLLSSQQKEWEEKIKDKCLYTQLAEKEARERFTQDLKYILWDRLKEDDDPSGCNCGGDSEGMKIRAVNEHLQESITRAKEKGYNV